MTFSLQSKLNRRSRALKYTFSWKLAKLGDKEVRFKFVFIFEFSKSSEITFYFGIYHSKYLFAFMAFPENVKTAL